MFHPGGVYYDRDVSLRRGERPAPKPPRRKRNPKGEVGAGAFGGVFNTHRQAYDEFFNWDYGRGTGELAPRQGLRRWWRSSHTFWVAPHAAKKEVRHTPALQALEGSLAPAR